MKKLPLIIILIVIVAGGLYLLISKNQMCLDGSAVWYFDKKFIALQDTDDLYRNVVAKSSSCAKTKYEIKESGSFKKTSETEFNSFLQSYNNDCSNCLIYTKRSLGENTGYFEYSTNQEL